MKLILSLSVLVVALLMISEGPAPAKADSSIPQELKDFGSTVAEKAKDAVTTTWKWLSEKFIELKNRLR